MRIRHHVYGLLLFCLLLPSSGKATNLFGDFKRLPDEIERGFTVGFDFGLLFITNQDRTTATNPGFALSFITGYDFSDYFSLEGIYTLGISEAAPNDPLLGGGVNTLFLNLVGRAQIPLGRLYPFFEVGPGIAYSKPEFERGENYKLSILFAGGVEYYTYLRHFSVYAKAGYVYITGLPINALSTSIGLKYTF